jgi:hypothetical protein
MLLHGIFFYFPPSSAFYYMFEGGRLGIGGLGLGYGSFFPMISKNFRWSICYMHKF